MSTGKISLIDPAETGYFYPMATGKETSALWGRIERRMRRLKEKYPDRKISMRSLSLQMGSESFIKNIKDNPSQSPRGTNLKALADVLETSPEWLLDGSGPEEPGPGSFAVPSESLGAFLDRTPPDILLGIERGIATSYRAFFRRDRRGAAVLASIAMQYLRERPVRSMNLDQVDDDGVGILSEILARRLSDETLSKSD